MAIANASVFAFSALLDSMTPPTQRWIAVESRILRCCFFAAQLFDAKHTFSTDTWASRAGHGAGFQLAS
jgi:uncharacterized membrane protein